MVYSEKKRWSPHAKNQPFSANWRRDRHFMLWWLHWRSIMWHTRKTMKSWPLNSRDSTLNQNRNSDVDNKQDQLPVLSQMCLLQGLTINYAPFTPKLKHLQSYLIKNSLKLFFSQKLLTDLTTLPILKCKLQITGVLKIIWILFKSLFFHFLKPGLIKSV